MLDHTSGTLHQKLKTLLEEVNHQPNWGVMGLAQSAVAGYVATGGQTKKLQQRFHDVNEVLKLYIEEAKERDASFVVTQTMSDFLEGRVLQNFMWQKYNKVKKSVNELLHEIS